MLRTKKSNDSSTQQSQTDQIATDAVNYHDIGKSGDKSDQNPSTRESPAMAESDMSESEIGKTGVDESWDDID